MGKKAEKPLVIYYGTPDDYFQKWWREKGENLRDELCARAIAREAWHTAFSLAKKG